MGLSQRGSDADLAPDAAQDLLSAPVEAALAEATAAPPATEGSPNQPVAVEAADGLKGAGANGLQHGSSEASTFSSDAKLDHKPSTASSEADSEASSAAQSAGMSPHYDAAGDIILRLEFLRTPEFKTILRSVVVAVLGGLVMLSVALAFKIDKPPSFYLEDDTVPIVNLCFAGVLMPALVACCAFFFYRVYRSNLSGKRWSHRRRRAATLGGIEISLQVVNCLFFIIPNGWVLSHDCAWFDPIVIWSGFVRWTIWNTIFLIYVVQAHSANPATTRRWRKYVQRGDGAVMDAPLHMHWPKLGLWLALEGILLALSITILRHPSAMEWDPSQPDCRKQPWNCHFSDAGLTLLVLNVSCVVTYFILWLFFILRAFNNLTHLPYNGMRMANMTTRIQIRLRGLSITFFVLCIICYSFVMLNTCSSYIISWLGFLPMQLVMTTTAIANTYMTMPKRPLQTGILQVWLQEFAWLERDIQRKKAERASSLPDDSYEGFCLDCEPLWCFETTVKLMYWSFLVYDYQEEAAGAPSPYNPDTALLLYQLEHWECMWEKSLDTKAVVGWNDDTVVIAFRGTASMANVKADLQVWRTRYPAGVGSVLMRTAPMVHQGFHRAYTANGFNDKLLSRLEHILYRCASQQKSAGGDRPVNVFVTGHSLGGALATLCAFDIKKRCPCAEYLINVHCYTFGAPRVGNHAFVRLYNEAVPDTWHVINNDDVITKAGKFWNLYKRTGHRVLVNKLGDLVVRPSYVETAIRGVPGGASVRDHLLTQYQKAVMAVVASQFSSKSLAHGKDGVLSLAQTKGVGSVLHTAGLTAKELRVLRERGWDAYQRLLRRQAKRQRSQRPSRLPSCSSQVADEGGQGAPAAQLEAVVVRAEAEVGAGQGPDVAVQALAAVAAEPEPDPALAEVTLEEKDGVMHKCEMRRRAQCGRRCTTVCSLMGRLGGAAVAPAPLPAAPEADAPAPPSLEGGGSGSGLDGHPLQAVSEEEEGLGLEVEGLDAEGDSLPSTPGSAPADRATRRAGGRRRAGWWARQKQHLASALGWATSPLSSATFSRTSSMAPSLAATSMSDASPTHSITDTRGSQRDAPVIPLVLDSSPEALSGRALSDYAAAEAARQMAEGAAARAAAAAAQRPQPAPPPGMPMTPEALSGWALQEHADKQRGG